MKFTSRVTSCLLLLLAANQAATASTVANQTEPATSASQQRDSSIIKLAGPDSQLIPNELTWISPGPYAKMAGYQASDSPLNDVANLPRLDSRNHESLISGHMGANRQQRRRQLMDSPLDGIVDKGSLPMTPEQILVSSAADRRSFDEATQYRAKQRPAQYYGPVHEPQMRPPRANRRSGGSETKRRANKRRLAMAGRLPEQELAAYSPVVANRRLAGPDSMQFATPRSYHRSARKRVSESERERARKREEDDFFKDEEVDKRADEDGAEDDDDRDELDQDEPSPRAAPPRLRAAKSRARPNRMRARPSPPQSAEAAADGDSDEDVDGTAIDLRRVASRDQQRPMQADLQAQQEALVAEQPRLERRSDEGALQQQQQQPVAQPDLQVAAGHHHKHHHGHYYQHVEVPKKGAWKFGFKRGNHKHEIERHEKGHKHKFHSSFKWHAKEKCKKKKKCKSVGKMTWHYEHHKKHHHG